ncbi:MAG: hypothetical protein M1830_008687, partial [Pleopsidium flavum]
NADGLLRDVLKAVDTNEDGRIQYNEFRAFIEQTERELWQLFKSIDRDQNGQLDKSELQAAFRRAHLVIPNSKLDQFFAEVDTNHDGVISFDEWRSVAPLVAEDMFTALSKRRNFLLFIPANAPGLKAVLSYYSSTVTVNPEGDVQVSGDTTQGLGMHQFLTTFFGSIVKIASTKRQNITSVPPAPVSNEERHLEHKPIKDLTSFPWDPGNISKSRISTPESAPSWSSWKFWKPVLTDNTPDPGYFLAGGIAGVISRTATAPLDRLKVYLIAQTGVKEEAVQAAKSGAPVQAAKKATRPLVDASKELWRAGGMRSLFAGNGLNVIKVMPESAIKFGAYEGSKKAFAHLEGHGDPRELNPWSQFFSAGMGGMISQFFVYPLDTLKFRMQCETVSGGLHGNLLIAATARKMWLTNGLRSFYRGLPMGLVGMFPYAAIDLSTFEYLKRAISTHNASIRGCHEDDAAPGNFATGAIGAFSGALGASVVYPLNLLRTRLQAQGTAVHPPTYTGIWEVTMRTVRGEGVRGLFKGITPNLLKVVPAVSITYVVYENSKKALGLR